MLLNQPDWRNWSHFYLAAVGGTSLKEVMASTQIQADKSPARTGSRTMPKFLLENKRNCGVSVGLSAPVRRCSHSPHSAHSGLKNKSDFHWIYPDPPGSYLPGISQNISMPRITTTRAEAGQGNTAKSWRIIPAAGGHKLELPRHQNKQGLLFPPLPSSPGDNIKHQDSCRSHIFLGNS